MDPRDAYHLGSVPLGVAIAGLFVIVMARSHATYWAGRLRTETRGWLEATLDAAEDLEPLLDAKAHLSLGLIIGGGPLASRR